MGHINLLASAYKSIEVEARVVPACRHCGQAAALHTIGTHGYDPRIEIKDPESIAFQSNDIIANLLWKLEQFFKRLRLFYIQES